MIKSSPTSRSINENHISIQTKIGKEYKKYHLGERNEFGQKLLGFEVDKPSKFSIKTLSAMEYIESDIQNIEAPRTDDHII